MGRQKGSRRRVVKSLRQLVSRLLVVAEGKQTEPQYVEQLAARLRSRGTTTFDEIHRRKGWIRLLSSS
ncbi:hypothetical protein KEM60_02112 [Austwickia sp. TVS 96-490-7B]|nr:hypothetical protein [Austwickia sp. TVS 96-490-7B]